MAKAKNEPDDNIKPKTKSRKRIAKKKIAIKQPLELMNVKPRALSAQSIVDDFKRQMKNYWAWADIDKFSPFSSDKNKEIFDNVLAATPAISKDKSIEFNAVLSEMYLYCVSWFPIEADRMIIAMKTDPVPFRRGYNSTTKWADLFDELNVIDGVMLTNFIDITNSNISTFQIICLEPRILQGIDALIQKTLEIESKEYIDKLRNPSSNVNTFYDF